MLFSRRQCLGLALAAVGTSAAAYPRRAIRMVVGFAPGGTSTSAARIMADWLSQRLRQPVVVENRPGAGGNHAIREVAHAAPDGYTLLLLPVSALVNRVVFAKLPFDVLSDIAPVAGLATLPMAMVVRRGLGVSTVADFIRAARQASTPLSMASFGVGTTSHLAGELFQAKTNVRMVHVPYRGEIPGLTDLVGERVDVMFTVLSSVGVHLKAGTLIALGVTATTRDDSFPDIPPIAETVDGFEVNSWLGVGVPRGASDAILRRLNDEINAGLADAAIRKQLLALGAQPLLFSPEEFSRFIASEARAWTDIVQHVGLEKSQ